MGESELERPGAGGQPTRSSSIQTSAPPSGAFRAAARPLCEITRDDHEIGTQFTHLFDQTFDHARMGVTEMYI